MECIPFWIISVMICINWCANVEALNEKHERKMQKIFRLGQIFGFGENHEQFCTRYKHEDETVHCAMFDNKKLFLSRINEEIRWQVLMCKYTYANYEAGYSQPNRIVLWIRATDKNYYNVEDCGDYYKIIEE